MNPSTLRIIVAAGGTGGDLFPAIAVIEQLQRRMPVEALFVGNPNRIEARVVPQLGFRFEGLSVRGFKGLLSWQSYALPLTITQSTLKVRRLIKEFKPQLALCAGTYISYPLALAASSARVPLALIESNAIPGKANRQVAQRASLIIAAFEETRQYFDSRSHDVIRVIGNPIRQRFDAMPSREDAARVFGLDPHKHTLLVFGGSLGARSINTAIQQSIDALHADGIQVLWQTGASVQTPPNLPDGVRVLSFIDDMAAAYAACDLVLCRAGGGTVAELTVVGKPALLVPYPHAANNEQEHNARALESRGAAVMIKDGDVQGRALELIRSLMKNDERRREMAEAMRGLARPHAASDAANAVLELLG